MGKVRKLRQKYHLSKAKSARETARTATPVKIPSANKLNEPAENIFAGLDISVDSLAKSLDRDFDAKSVASTKSRKELKLEEQHLKKKDKLTLRRERFMQKLHVAQQAMKPGKNRKKEETVPRKSDSLENNMTPLESLFPFRKMDKNQKPVAKGIMKMGKRLRKQTLDANLMKRMLKNKNDSNSPQYILNVLKSRVCARRGPI